jgi:hypothetical protein
MVRISIHSFFQGFGRAFRTLTYPVTCNLFQVTISSPDPLGDLYVQFKEDTNPEPTVHIVGFRREKLGHNGWNWPEHRKTVIIVKGGANKAQTIERVITKVYAGTYSYTNII